MERSGTRHGGRRTRINTIARTALWSLATSPPASERRQNCSTKWSSMVVGRAVMSTLSLRLGDEKSTARFSRRRWAPPSFVVTKACSSAREPVVEGGGQHRHAKRDSHGLLDPTDVLHAHQHFGRQPRLRLDPCARITPWKACFACLAGDLATNGSSPETRGPHHACAELRPAWAGWTISASTDNIVRSAISYESGGYIQHPSEKMRE